MYKAETKLSNYFQIEVQTYGYSWLGHVLSYRYVHILTLYTNSDIVTLDNINNTIAKRSF